MHYDSIENKHGLAHDPFKALIAPRPIGWITSVGSDGVCNLAPYSFFNAVSDRPHYVMFSSSNVKDSLRNVSQTGEFTCSMATWDTREGMNISSAPVPPDADEYPLAGLTAVASKFVKPPRVKESPVAFECRHWKTIELPDVEPGSERGHFIVIGEVVGIYIDDRYIKDGMVDTGAMQPIARMGYMEYAVVKPETVFDINRPLMNPDGTIAETQSGAWDGVYR
jgi:flavin reductase (DIM6/NTAB) family NADH-FMN oxidoreductase RutF